MLVRCSCSRRHRRASCAAAPCRFSILATLVAVTAIVSVAAAAAMDSHTQGGREVQHQKHAENLRKFHATVPRNLAASPSYSYDTSQLRQQILATPSSFGSGMGPLRVIPTQFGGDPTGVKDSTAAINACLQVCLNQSALSPNGYFPGQDSFGDGKKILDMGGCIVDLNGGEYRISSTIHIPEFNANMNMGFGSLVASDTFPKTDFLIVIGTYGGCKYPQGSCNIDINFPNMFFDARNRAAGCIEINNVMGVTIGPGSYFLNFTQYGVQINGGHEVMMDRCWLGETNFDYNYVQFHTPPNATAIQINGNDHYILNTIVFSSKIGVEVNGAADYISGTHVWFPDNLALHYNDTMAFHVTDSGNRFSGCYIDGGRAVFEANALSKNIWTNGFECCAAVGNVPHGILLRGDKLGPGLIITQNIFGGGSIYYEPTSSTATPSMVDSVIERNSFAGNARGSRITRTQSSTTAQAEWAFDLCDVLAVPLISSVMVSVTSDGTAFPQYVVRPPVGCNVTISTAPAFTGSVTISVDSSTYDNNFA